MLELGIFFVGFAVGIGVWHLVWGKVEGHI